MKRLVFMMVILFLTLNGCEGSLPIEPPLTATSAPSTITPVLPTATITPIPEGKTILVTSAGDSGPGTLRQAILDAKSGDTIMFDLQIFPPDNPTTIFLDNERQDTALPEVTQGYLIIDASDAGVILDGSHTSGEWVNCLSIRSNGNVVRGLQIVHFPGSGLALMGGSQNNIIGGDRNKGSGPLGQGNLSSGNRTGIDLQDNATSFNVITGNLIGADADGLPFQGKQSQDTGIYIANGASHNTVGSGNIIAYNLVGVQVHKSNSLGNTITQNGIYDNMSTGISLNAKGNASAIAPSIVGYDLTGGSVTVFTCPHCTVEIYSDKNGQGEVYETGGTADEAGVLTLDKGASFRQFHLTATATDKDGNTSGFSLPTSGESLESVDALQTKSIQSGNNHAKRELVSKSSTELEDNRMGTFTGSLWHLEPEVYPDSILNPNNIFDMGFKRFRLTINSMETPTIDWDKPELTIEPVHDEFITKLAENGVTITYVLSFWDTDNLEQGGRLEYPRFGTEEEIKRYLEYVRFIVHHFKDRIKYYEIWNEPNHPNPDYTPQQIEAEDYIKLVEQVVPVIRQEYPQAKIVVGGTTSLIDTDSQTYLFKILNSDLMPQVDAISWHPMYGSSPEYDRHRQYYNEYPRLVQEIKDTARLHGFVGEFVADEIHWPTPSQPEEGWPTYSNIQSVKYLTRSVIVHLGMDVTVTQLLLVNNPQLYSTNACLSTIMAGNQTTDLPVTIQSHAPYIRSYGFSLPNGDNLLAIWNDGIAVDYDPGIPSTLILPNRAGQKAVGVDVLNGFEQELISTDENGNLVIRDFLLKDYPILIRLSQH